MVDQEHLRMLRQNVQQWNIWRKEHSEIQSDFTNANLNGTDLNRAYLRDAYLISADLSGANLKDADLIGAYLNGANLSSTNLSDANLSGAYLSGANLSDANLSGAYLRDTNLSNIELNRANLGHVIMERAILGDLDLREVKGLETVRHTGPSYLSINTIYKSEGNIPEVFMRGMGAPDEFLEYMRILAGKPFEYYSCFISYSSKDQEFAEQLYNDLQGCGVRCWFARKDLKPGDFYRDRIDTSINVYDKVVLILSENSIKSKWVEEEVEKAWEREMHPAAPGEPVVLFPIRLDDTVMQTERVWARQLRYLRHIGDFTGWKDDDAYQTHFQELLHDLKQERAPRKP